jgi:hypothetical protein
MFLASWPASTFAGVATAATGVTAREREERVPRSGSQGAARGPRTKTGRRAIAAARPEKGSGRAAYFFFFAFFAAFFLRFFAAMEISLMAHGPLGRARELAVGGLPTDRNTTTPAERSARSRDGRRLRRRRFARHASAREDERRVVGASRLTHARIDAARRRDGSAVARRTARLSRVGLLLASRIETQ